MNEIARHNSQQTIVAGSDASSTADKINVGLFGGAAILMSHTANAATINWYGAATAGGTPVQIYSDGNAVKTAVTVGIHPLPDATFAVPFVVPVLNAGTTATLIVMRKG